MTRAMPVGSHSISAAEPLAPGAVRRRWHTFAHTRGASTAHLATAMLPGAQDHRHARAKRKNPTEARLSL